MCQEQDSWSCLWGQAGKSKSFLLRVFLCGLPPGVVRRRVALLTWNNPVKSATGCPAVLVLGESSWVDNHSQSSQSYVNAAWILKLVQILPQCLQPIACALLYTGENRIRKVLPSRRVMCKLETRAYTQNHLQRCSLSPTFFFSFF